jgi:hypothetical protein
MSLIVEGVKVPLDRVDPGSVICVDRLFLPALGEGKSIRSKSAEELRFEMQIGELFLCKE